MSSSLPLPAILGGPAVRPQGPPAWPLLDEEIQQAMLDAWRDGSWGKYHGGHVEKLTKRLAEHHGVEFTLTCGSGTFAVELALRALAIEPGQEVIVAAYDYPGNFLAVHAVGAIPVLIDVAANNWNLAVDRIAAAVSPKTRAVIVSHLHGGLVPLREVMAVASGYGLSVIEDAAQQPGARVQGRPTGTWGDVGVLSFGGSKLLTAGRGGALLTRRADVFQRARLVQFRAGNLVNPLSELQAAVLLPQLARLEEQNRIRARAVQHLIERLADVPGLRPFDTPIDNRIDDSAPGYYKLGFQYDAAAFGLPRDRFLAAMRAEGIAMDDGFRALHVGRSMSRFRAAGTLTEAERAHHGCVVLHHPVLLGSEADLDEVVLAVRKGQRYASQLA